MYDPTRRPAPTADYADEEAFLFAFETHVLWKALPAFEEASRYARDRGLDCQVELLTDADGHPELCLLARLGGGQQHSSYRIVADTENQGLVHYQYAVHGEYTRRLPAHLASIDSGVLDTQLADFFLHAFGMHLGQGGSPAPRRAFG